MNNFKNILPIVLGMALIAFLFNTSGVLYIIFSLAFVVVSVHVFGLNRGLPLSFVFILTFPLLSATDREFQLGLGFVGCFIVAAFLNWFSASLLGYKTKLEKEQS
jgi:hypothetical protein